MELRWKSEIVITYWFSFQLASWLLRIQPIEISWQEGRSRLRQDFTKLGRQQEAILLLKTVRLIDKAAGKIA